MMREAALASHITKGVTRSDSHVSNNNDNSNNNNNNNNNSNSNNMDVGVIQRRCNTHRLSKDLDVTVERAADQRLGQAAKLEARHWFRVRCE